MSLEQKLEENEFSPNKYPGSLWLHFFFFFLHYGNFHTYTNAGKGSIQTFMDHHTSSVIANIFLIFFFFFFLPTACVASPDVSTADCVISTRSVHSVAGGVAGGGEINSHTSYFLPHLQTSRQINSGLKNQKRCRRLWPNSLLILIWVDFDLLVPSMI